MNNNVSSNDEELINQKLYNNYRNPNSSTFLETNPHKLYSATKKEANLFPVSYSEIQKFKETVESISKSFQRRVLRSRNRHLQYRSWRSYSPLDIIVADICFLPSTTNSKNGKKTILLVLLDAFSRLVKLNVLKNSSSRETIAKFEESLRFFGANETYSYTKFTSDRG